MAKSKPMGIPRTDTPEGAERAKKLASARKIADAKIQAVRDEAIALYIAEEIGLETLSETLGMTRQGAWKLANKGGKP